MVYIPPVVYLVERRPLDPSPSFEVGVTLMSLNKYVSYAGSDIIVTEIMSVLILFKNLL